ncbi:hypothetical protein VCRA2113O325_10591 [Vibrio crassostreae]|nr:hypothetical protein VCRA2113O325_10591 [Vibrio crassostreae]CAK3877879.1 hypothetical protein VCRA2130O400_240043 [Vibrio crassostreae]CDT43067.1 hypothetical protein VCR20J5_290009 [Vibrio crassostreae]
MHLFALNHEWMNWLRNMHVTNYAIFAHQCLTFRAEAIEYIIRLPYLLALN